MKAAAISAYGGPDVISVLDVPAPELHADDVLVRVAATSFNLWTRRFALVRFRRS